MTNYTPDDFTDIRGPEEKPTVPGWYISSTYGQDSILRLAKQGWNSISFFTWWDGNRWCYHKRYKYARDFCDNQYRYWFGLKERP